MSGTEGIPGVHAGEDVKTFRKQRQKERREVDRARRAMDDDRERRRTDGKRHA